MWVCLLRQSTAPDSLLFQLYCACLRLLPRYACYDIISSSLPCNVCYTTIPNSHLQDEEEEAAELALLRDMGNEDDWGLEALTNPGDLVIQLEHHCSDCPVSKRGRSLDGRGSLVTTHTSSRPHQHIYSHPVVITLTACACNSCVQQT